MELNSSTYYSIQNFGTDYYVGRNGNTIESSSSNIAWQIGSCTGSSLSFIRFADSCLVAETSGTLLLTPCDASSGSWNITSANGQDSGDGFYLINTQADSLALSSDLGPPPVVVMVETPDTTQPIPEFAWGFQEIARDSWPDSTPQALEFCANTTSQGPSTSTMASVSTDILTTTSISASATTSGAQSASEATTQPTSSASTAAATNAPSGSHRLTLAKSFLLAMVGLSFCLHVI